jgi:type I restriction enzyme S subunit
MKSKMRGGRELREVAEIEASTTDSFGPYDDYVGLDSISSSSSQIAPVKVFQAEISGTARVLREGPIISKLRPYLNKVSYIPAELANAVGSTEILCVRPNVGISGWYIYGVLKLPCTVRQFQPLANGSTHPRIVGEDVLEAMIPWHDEAERLGRNLERAQTMYLSAERFSTAAKLIVEALIEGKVTEAELIAAQEALDRGDTSLDRALLSRLTRQGIDIPGQPPLFPDLDALYALLEEVNLADSE